MPETCPASSRPDPSHSMGVRAVTATEFSALPDGPIERMLIRGRLWERSYEFKDRWHSGATAAVAGVLGDWSEDAPAAGRSYIFVECLLRRDEDSVVPIDVAYASPGQVTSQPEDSPYLVGPPTLAVEILSPSDKVEEIQAKLDEYLAAGVPVVWVVDPHFKTVTVHRPGRGPEMLHGDAVLADETHLPDFGVAVAELFPEGRS